jgi:hypothetical protein
MFQEESLQLLSYRELQALAKENSIPANKKKDEIIRLLLAKKATHLSNPVTPFKAAEAVEVLISSIEAPKREECEAVFEGTPISATADIEDNEQFPFIQDDPIVRNLTDSFANGLHLKGLPSPQGKKTVFEDTVLSPANYLINWG